MGLCTSCRSVNTHIFPQKHRRNFQNAGLDIDDPKYGAWLETKLHLQKAWAYNKAWEDFFKNHPNATMEEILEQAEILMKEIYGQ